jgi:general L-amino acid transport system permease protein
MSNLSYVRSEMLLEQTPPVNQQGLVKWARENLFSGWLNTILTLMALYIVVTIVLSLGPWLMNSVWNAENLSECRIILDGASGACFAVIKDRWHQLLFGFYPSDLYWRPILTLIFMLVAIAPVLFSSVPRRMFIFSALFPAIGFWLLWGGTIWLPIVAMFGFVVGFFAYKVVHSFNSLGAVFAAIMGPLLWWLFLSGPITSALSGLIPLGIQEVQSGNFGGFMVSITIGFSGIVLSLPIGILLALGRRSDMIFVKTVCVVFIEFIRGVPLITLLFTASLLLNYFLPPGTNFDLILRVIIMVTVFASAYMAEVVRGGLAALPKGQYEAADALGMDYWKSQRLIIMPQALKISIPGIVNTFIGLFKDTTLVVFIGLLDPIGLSNAIRADSDWTGIYWELFIFIGALFFIVCFSMSRYSQYLERRLKTDNS